MCGTQKYSNSCGELGLNLKKDMENLVGFNDWWERSLLVWRKNILIFSKFKGDDYSQGLRGPAFHLIYYDLQSSKELLKIREEGIRECEDNYKESQKALKEKMESDF